MPRSSLVSGVVFLAICTPLAHAASARVDFNREIRPILAENCFYRHGQDPNHRQGTLRLDQRVDALKPAECGQISSVPGKAAESALMEQIFSTEKAEQENAFRSISAARLRGIVAGRAKLRPTVSTQALTLF